MFTQRPARRVATALSVALLGAALLAGAAQAKTSVKGTWAEGAPHDTSFSRVLVVGVSPSVNQRCAFEFFMASRLQGESVQVIPSCQVVKEKTPLTRESIEQAVAAIQADAVLAP